MENTLSVFHPDVDRWVALRTAARWEKQVATSLVEVQVPVFLPLIRRVTQYRSKRQSFLVPMFSGYVFCSEADFLGNPRVSPACRNRIAQVLRPPDPGLLRDELAEVAEVLGSHQLVQERVFGRPGEVVHIVGGSFAGNDGVVLRLKPNQRKLVLRISFLGTQVEVDIEEHNVRKCL